LAETHWILCRRASGIAGFRLLRATDPEGESHRPPRLVSVGLFGVASKRAVRSLRPRQSKEES
jgi:hypothetical protein